MNKIRVSKVDNVTLWKQGQSVAGSLHLTSHHLIFKYVPPSTSQDKPDLSPAPPPRQKELWVTYPVIANCVYRPSQSSLAPSAIHLRCRDFSYIAFHFSNDEQATDVYESIRALTCRLGRIEKLYAYSYKPPPQEAKYNGWNVYDTKREFARQGISSKSADRGWRISKINDNYEYSPTYPRLILVPSTISDNTLNYAVKFRSRGRIPALTYLHPVNNCSLTRCSQPLVGVRNNRSAQDEKLVKEIFATSKNQASDAPLPSSYTSTSMATMDSLISAASGGDPPRSITPDPEDQDLSENTQEEAEEKIYGSQHFNLIVDARPVLNAELNRANGMGSENMENYRPAKREYLGIANIHKMRSSLDKVVNALKHSDFSRYAPIREQLENSEWRQHIGRLLYGADIVARHIGIMASHVLLHCSDGWDRTSQISALSQICLDPYYRTIEGFMVLVEKDWVSFGHKFSQRSGFLSSEKWFEVEGERINPNRGASSRGGPPGSQAAAANPLENALTRATAFFNRKSDVSKMADESDSDPQSTEASPAVRRSSAPPTDKKIQTKVDEVSPMFHQFLDATYQLLCQHPTRFEFNERFLRRLLYHLYSCQYGTFLFDSEKDRVESKCREKTRSVWDYFLGRKQEFKNERYDPDIDDRTVGKERLIFPDSRNVRWWAEVFQRKDEEMNSPLPQNQSNGQFLQNLTGVVESARTRDPSPAPGLAPNTRITKAISADNLNRPSPASAGVAPILPTNGEQPSTHSQTQLRSEATVVNPIAGDLDGHASLAKEAKHVADGRDIPAGGTADAIPILGGRTDGDQPKVVEPAANIEEGNLTQQDPQNGEPAELIERDPLGGQPIVTR